MKATTKTENGGVTVKSRNIICVRHGKPAFRYPPGRSRIRAFEFNELARLYDEAGLEGAWNAQRAGERLDHYTLSSDLPRALDTARLLSSRPESEWEVDEIFREVPLPPFKKNRRLPAALFLVASRVGWYLGWMKGKESAARSRERVRRAADVLEARVADRGTVALYAHGFFLFLLTRELRKRGWQCDKRGAFRYLERALFSKISH